MLLSCNPLFLIAVCLFSCYSDCGTRAFNLLGIGGAGGGNRGGQGWMSDGGGWVSDNNPGNGWVSDQSPSNGWVSANDGPGNGWVSASDGPNNGWVSDNGGAVETGFGNAGAPANGVRWTRRWVIDSQGNKVWTTNAGDGGENVVPSVQANNRNAFVNNNPVNNVVVPTNNVVRQNVGNRRVFPSPQVNSVKQHVPVVSNTPQPIVQVAHQPAAPAVSERDLISRAAASEQVSNVAVFEMPEANKNFVVQVAKEGLDQGRTFLDAAYFIQQKLESSLGFNGFWSVAVGWKPGYSASSDGEQAVSFDIEDIRFHIWKSKEPTDVAEMKENNPIRRGVVAQQQRINDLSQKENQLLQTISELTKKDEQQRNEIYNLRLGSDRNSNTEMTRLIQLEKEHEKTINDLRREKRSAETEMENLRFKIVQLEKERKKLSDDNSRLREAVSSYSKDEEGAWGALKDVLESNPQA